MSFFDDEEEQQELRHGAPDRLYAPSGTGWAREPEQYYLPAVLPWTRELARGEDAVIALRGVLVWPDSCTFELVSFLRRTPGASAARFPAVSHSFRFGVLFADGRRATHAAWASRPPHPDRVDDEPILQQNGGSGGQFHMRLALILRPLPPDGPFTLVVDWSEQGIAETWTELDGTELRGRTADVVEIWDNLPTRPEGEQSSGYGAW